MNGYDDDPGDGPSRIDEHPLAARLLRGGCILDVPAVPDAVWGDGHDVLWAVGQSLIIAGPDGVGKTTLAGNLIEARLGIGTGSVLGMPVKPGDRNVLVLLMDRPQQAMAALARLFTQQDRDTLDARLRIWRGPPPRDLAVNPTVLTELCDAANADTCIVDSLKDAATELSKDEAGSGWNRARQFAIESGTELIELHHPRKGQDGNRKPSRLDDLYGSRWIPAGAGSIISLWGQAGDPIVEFTHLKPVTEPVGPWRVDIDGMTGRVARSYGIDLLEQIRLRGSEGITAVVAARLVTGSDKPTRSDIERARRRLERMTAESVLVRVDGGRGGGHERNHATWFLTALTEPLTPNHANQEIARQSSHATNHAPFTDAPTTINHVSPPLFNRGGTCEWSADDSGFVGEEPPF